MDYLFIAIKNLSNKELQLLRKRIDKQSQKLRLFNLLYEHEELEMSHSTVMEQMGYAEKPAGFYTLKNRLHEDVMEVRMEIEKNEVILTKEKVQSLRGLVYSRDAVTLLREMRRLERKCFELELFAEQKEIYFCYMMIYRHDRKNLENYKSLMRDAESKHQAMMKMEEIFYTKLLDTQDMFYYKSSFHFREAEESLRQVEQMHQSLQCKSSEFLYLSAKLTLRLNETLKPGVAESRELFKDLVHLHKVYHNSFLIHRYPNCDIAIQCLLSKYYYLSGMMAQFESVQKDIMEKINTITGFKMFECTIFYFIYISLASKVDHWTRQQLADQVKLFLSEANLEYFSNRLKNYFYYLLAIEAYYQGDFYKSSSLLLRSRKYFNMLDATNCWIAVENILLNLYNYSRTNELRMISSELALLSRVVARFNLEEHYVRPIKEVIKITRNCLSKKDFSRYDQEIASLRSGKNSELYRLVLMETA